MLSIPVLNWKENEGGGMPSSRAPPTGTNILASGVEATDVAMLAAIDEDRISMTNDRFVDAACTTTNALVELAETGEGGAPPRFPSLSPLCGERP